MMGDRQWPDPRGWEALTQAEAERDAARREREQVEVLRRELRDSIHHAEIIPFDWRDSHPSPGEVTVLLDALDRAERERDQAREALRKAADDLARMVADNKRGPEYGWTHQDEQADQLQRVVMYVVDDLRAALAEESQT